VSDYEATAEKWEPVVPDEFPGYDLTRIICPSCDNTMIDGVCARCGWEDPS
jgi:hypothetical protein